MVITKRRFDGVSVPATVILLLSSLMPSGFAQTQAAPDNSGNNKAQNQSQTADQQKEKRSDRDITQQIRRSIVKEKSFSTYAHNVKIITENGMVTLKGPVRSEEEKMAVQSKAAEVAGADKVTNRLDVKPKSK